LILCISRDRGCLRMIRLHEGLPGSREVRNQGLRRALLEQRCETVRKHEVLDVETPELCLEIAER
jgi:hypothetical protein